jgi:hypothetical protein
MDALGVFNSVQGLALDSEHSVTVAAIQDTFIEDWSQYKDEHPEEVCDATAFTKQRRAFQTAS